MNTTEDSSVSNLTSQIKESWKKTHADFVRRGEFSLAHYVLECLQTKDYERVAVSAAKRGSAQVA